MEPNDEENFNYNVGQEQPTSSHNNNNSNHLAEIKSSSENTKSELREDDSLGISINYSIKQSMKENHRPMIISTVTSSVSLSNTAPVTCEPLPLPTCNTSSNLAKSHIKPPTLLQLCVARLNNSSINLLAFTKMNPNQRQFESCFNELTFKSAGLSTPDSLISAPPSYSFVLRQIDIRRRPRLVGTFVPSPSFVIHTPPPTYATAFDIYLDSPIPHPTRTYNFGFTPMPVVCPHCGFSGMSLVTSRVTICTHLCAATLCIFCCWICVPLPYILRSCKNVYHYCRNCRSFLGMYCPTNSENVY